MGVFFYFFLLFLLVDLIILLLAGLRIFSFPPSDFLRFTLTTGVMLVTLMLVIYGTYNASRVEQVSYNLTLRGAGDEDLRLVLVSDLHLGAIHSERNLKQSVAKINEMDADIVCLVGDIFNDDYALINDPDEVMRLFRGIKSKYGVYASLGNHDGGKSLNQFLTLLKESEIKTLLDDHVLVDDKFVLVGRLDPSPIGGFGQMTRAEVGQVMSDIDTSYPIIVMDHSPSMIDEYGSEVDLILAGHTHGGQIYPFNFATRRAFAVDYGYYQRDHDSVQVIVTSGASTWGMPMRIGSMNELVLINLHLRGGFNEEI